MGKENNQLNYAIVAKGHTPMYVMHKYWARKPHNVVKEYVEYYTKEGDIVLDPFSGSGVTAMESLKLNRKAVAVDLDPISTFIAKNTAIPFDTKKIKEKFKHIESKIKNEINAFYETTCPKCKSKIPISCTHWKNSEPIKIMYICKHCKNKGSKDLEKEDLDKIKEIEKKKINYWYPKQKLYYNHSPFMKKEKSESIPDLFTKRNLLSLSLLYDSIEKIEDNKLKNLIKFAFTSMVHLASKLTPVRPTRQFSSFWALQSYWIPPLYMESNVWALFDSAINGRQGLIAGKEDSNKHIKKYKEAKKFSDLKDEENILIKTHNALELSEIIPKNSIDYIFTDPPYGGAVQYFELSTLWCSWLKFNLNYKDEITINKFQNKNFNYYHKMLKAVFRQMYLVLKPEKYLTVTFHSTDIKIWNSIIKAVIMAGFDLEKILYQPPARPSAKGLLQPYGSAVGDYYIRFKKPKSEKLITEKQMDTKSYELEVVLFAKRIIEERGEPTIYQHILNGIMVELKGGRYAPIGARNFEEILKEHIGKEFELIPIKDEKGKIVGKKWWLKDRDFSNFSTPALSDRVERVIINVLNKKIKVTFDDILQEIFITFPNALTPDTKDIKSILEEYAMKTKDGKWRLKPEVKVYESMHSRMIYLLSKLGKKAGFEIWVGSKEQGDLYKKRPLREFCDKINNFRFVSQESSIINRIKMIDVMWLNEGRIKYIFEVENTTGISEAIIRGSHIPNELNVRKFIVIPQQREKKLHNKLQEPILQQAVKKDNWRFILYDDLERLNQSTKKVFNPSKIQDTSKMPEDKLNSKQKKIDDTY